MSDIRRILEEIRDIEEAKTLLVDELDRTLDSRYKEVNPNEGEVWEVTLTHEDADNNAHNIPAIRTETGWVADPKWGSYLDDGPCGIDLYGSPWEDEHVYPHNKIH